MLFELARRGSSARSRALEWKRPHIDMRHLLLAWLVLPVVATAQRPGAQAGDARLGHKQPVPAAAAVRRWTPIVLDGKLDEPAWHTGIRIERLRVSAACGLHLVQREHRAPVDQADVVVSTEPDHRGRPGSAQLRGRSHRVAVPAVLAGDDAAVLEHQRFHLYRGAAIDDRALRGGPAIETAANHHASLNVSTRNAKTGLTSAYTIDPDGAGPAQAFTFDNPNFSQQSLRGNAVFRWEYRPGSVLYVAWTRSCFDQTPFGNLEFTRDREALFAAPPDNVFLVKAS
jgi:hypothetical protein